MGGEGAMQDVGVEIGRAVVDLGREMEREGISSTKNRTSAHHHLPFKTGPQNRAKDLLPHRYA